MVTAAGEALDRLVRYLQNIFGVLIMDGEMVAFVLNGQWLLEGVWGELHTTARSGVTGLQ